MTLDQVKDDVMDLLSDEENAVDIRRTATGFSVFVFGTKGFSFVSNTKGVFLVLERKYCDFQQQTSLLSDPLPNAKDEKPVKILINNTDDLIPYHHIFYQIYKDCQENENIDHFGCCNDFLTCSDKKMCVHQGIAYYRGCYYRKNLENGRIFYGKNKTI